MFTCSDKTLSECRERCLFGAPLSLRRWEHIRPGTDMLLYNVTSKRLSGPFTAASTCAHWDPDAWGGAYPRQVKIVHWPPNEAGVTVPRGTRGLHAGPLNGASISRLHQVIYGAAPLFTAEEVGVKRSRSRGRRRSREGAPSGAGA